MTEESPNQRAIGVNLKEALLNVVVANEKYKAHGWIYGPPIVESPSSIVYPTFGRANFHPRIAVINMFQNVLQFFGRVMENQRIYIKIFRHVCNYRVSRGVYWGN